MALEKEFFVPVDMHGLQIINHRLHMHSSNPISPNEGEIWYNNTLHEPKTRVTRGVTDANRALIADDDDFHNRLSEVVTIEGTDEIIIWDTSVSPADHKQQYRRVSRANFLSGMSTIQNAYKRVIADTGTQNLDATGEDNIAISGDGTIVETVGSANGINTLKINWKVQMANKVLAGPVSGGAAIPTFRSMIDNDMPTSYDAASWDTAYEHSLITLNNPHNVTYEEIGGLWERTGTVLSPINSGDSLTLAGATSHLILPLNSDAVTPTLAFGDGDTGIYEAADDILAITVKGTARLTLSQEGFRQSTNARFGLVNEDATSTNPNIVPNWADIDTGIGRAAADQLSLIAGGVEQLRLTQNDATVDVAGFTGNVEIAGSIKLLTGATVDTIETMLTNDDTHIPTSGAVYDYVVGGTHYKGEYNAATNVPDLDVSPSGILIGDMYTVTVGGTFFTEEVQAGDFLIAEVTDPTVLGDWTVVNKNIPPYNLLNLTDTPASYTGHAGKTLRVNSTPDGIEFVAGSALTRTNDTNVTLTLGGDPATSLLAATSLTLGWTGTLADGRIASAADWNTAYGWGNWAGHIHGNITNVGAIGSSTNLPIITTTAGVLVASSFGTGANTFCVGNDARLSDARTPTAHVLVSASHTASGLTAGHFLKATSTTAFGFTVHGLSYGDVGAAAASHNHAAGDITSGILGVARGGTGLGTVGTNYLLTGNGTGALTAEVNLTFDSGRLRIIQPNHGVNSQTLYSVLTPPNVTANITNYDLAQVILISSAYDIATGITDSGYRIGIGISAFVNEASFIGTLNEQYGIRIQYGDYTSATGGGHINVVYGIDLDFLESGSSTFGNVYSIYSSGTAKMYHAGNIECGLEITADDFILSSDIHLKKNIQFYPDFRALEKTLRLKPITYQWKDKVKTGVHLGFIAQEVQEVEPLLVTENEKGFLGISYSKITVLNNAAIHALNSKIESNEEKIARLEKQVKQLQDERS